MRITSFLAVNTTRAGGGSQYRRARRLRLARFEEVTAFGDDDALGCGEGSVSGEQRAGITFDVEIGNVVLCYEEHDDQVAERAVGRLEVVLLPAHCVTELHKRGVIGREMVREDSLSGEEFGEFWPVVRHDLLCQQDAAGRQDAVDLGGFDRFVAAQDEVEGAVAKWQDVGIRTRANDGDAKRPKTAKSDGCVDVPLLGGHEASVLASRDAREHFAAAGAKIEYPSGGRGVSAGECLIVPRERRAGVFCLDKRQVPAGEVSSAFDVRAEARDEPGAFVSL